MSLKSSEGRTFHPNSSTTLTPHVGQDGVVPWFEIWARKVGWERREEQLVHCRIVASFEVVEDDVEGREVVEEEGGEELNMQSG
jgi:hypothetical protein